MAAVIGSLRADLSVSIAKFEGDLGRAAQALERFGKQAARISSQLESAGSRMTMLITAPLVAFGATALRAAGDFEQSMNRVEALTQATGEELKKLKDQARELGGTTQFSASDAADAMGFLAMAGMKTNQIMGAMPHVLRLAGAAQLDMASAADIVTNILAGYNLQIDDLAHSNDVLVKAFTSANTDLQQLGEAMKYAGPVASAAGVQFEQAAAALAMMGNAGIQGSMAGTSLRGAITAALNPTKKMSDAMKAAGLNFKDAEGKLLPLDQIIQQLEPHAQNAGLFMTLFGQRAGPAMAALVSQGSDALRDLTGDLEDAAGTAQRVSEVQMKGFNGMLKEMESAFEELQLRIAESGLMDAISAIGLAFTSVLIAVGQLPDPLLNLVVIFAGLAAAIGPLLWIAGAFVGAVANLIPVMSLFAGAAIPVIASLMGIATAAWAAAAPFLPFIAIAGVVIAVAWKFRAAIAEAFGWVVEYLKAEVGPVFAELWQSLKSVVSSIAALFTSGPLAEAFNFLGWILAETVGLIVKILGGVLVRQLKIVISAVKIFVDYLAGAFRVVGLLLKGDFAGAWEEAKNTVAKLVDNILNVFDAIVPGLKSVLIAVGNYLRNLLVAGVQWAVSAVEKRFPGLVAAARAAAQGVIAWARNMFQGVKTWINDNLGPVIKWARDRLRELNNLFARIRRRQAELKGETAAPAAAETEAPATEAPTSPPALPPVLNDDSGGGSGRSKVDEIKKATEQFRDALEDVNDSIDKAFGKRELPRSMQQAEELRKRLADAEKEAREAGVSMSAFAASTAELRERIRDLEIEGLAKEAEVFARKVRDGARDVEAFGGSLSPLEDKLSRIDDQYQGLRDRIEDQIEANRVLAESNDVARDAMARLVEQLDRLDAAHKKATESARALHEAEERLKDLQAARDATDLGRQIRDLQERGGRGGILSKRQEEMRAIEEELIDLRMNAAIELAALEAEFIEAEMNADTAQMERLSQQIALQKELHALATETTAAQIKWAQDMKEAFDRFEEDLSSSLTDMAMNFKFDLESVRDVGKSLARDLFVKPFMEALAAKARSTIEGAISNFGGFFAEGGKLSQGQWGIVGENGPEMVFAGAGSLGILSNEDSFGSGSGGGKTAIFNISTPNPDGFRQSKRQMARVANEFLNQ